MRVSLRWLLVVATLTLTSALAADRAPRADNGARAIVSISVKGPLALVEVERALPTGEDVRSIAGLRTLELDLPEGASPVSFEIIAGARPLKLAAAATEIARADFAAALAAKTRTRAPVTDESADYRVSVSVPATTPARLRYRFTAPLACQRGRLVLAVPGALEVSPSPAEVRLAVEPGVGMAAEDAEVAGVPVHLRAAGGGWSALGRAPARAAWQVSFAVRGSGPVGKQRPAARVVAATGASRAGASGSRTTAIGLCRPDSPADRPLPDRLLLLIDRSRSVGPAGLSLERELSRQLILALPPTLRINAVLFDRGAVALFPLSRTATREAMAALDDALVPAALRNGSDVAAALRFAAELARGDGATAAATWLVVITDAALPPVPEGGAAFAGFPAASTTAAVLTIRPQDDEPATRARRIALAALPAQLGGVNRAIPAVGLVDAARDVIASLRQGGDLFAPRLVWTQGGVPAPGVGLGEALAPGQGLVKLAELPRGAGRLSVHATLAGRAIELPVVPVAVDARWLRRDDPPPGPAWFGAARDVVALVEPAHRAAPAINDGPIGQMDRDVVRNSLAFTFMPRARACYLNRPVKRAEDLDLRGRVSVELQLERGEMTAATIKSSTLGRPEIESCLVEAAFAVDVPRAMRADAPVAVVLNLVFQPRTSSKASEPSATAADIDVILGPVSFPSDPKALLPDLER